MDLYTSLHIHCSHAATLSHNMCDVTSSKATARQVREIKRAKTKDTQLGTEEVFSCAMTDSDGSRMPVEVAVRDVSRAHLYGKGRRWVYTTLPESHEQLGKLARLERNMYGTQDAASIWSSHVLRHIRVRRNVASECHGDDFVATASRRRLAELGE